MLRLNQFSDRLLTIFAVGTDPKKYRLKKRRKHIILSWILLLCFVTGQYVIYAHQHKTKSSFAFSEKKVNQQRRVKGSCDLCDAMLHTYMDMAVQVHLPALKAVSYFYYSSTEYITSIDPILSKGRSPPLS